MYLSNIVNIKNNFLINMLLVSNKNKFDLFSKQSIKNLNKPYSPKYSYHLNFFLYDYVNNNSFVMVSNNANKTNLKKFEIFFYNFILNNNKFIFLDTNYKSVYNLYFNMFNISTIQSNKNYLFVKPKFFTFKN